MSNTVVFILVAKGDFKCDA